MAEKKTLLGESDMPQQWYNVQADLPAPLSLPRSARPRFGTSP